MDIVALQQQLIRHEGIRFSPYKDSQGKLTIGVGHNIDDKPITQSDALHILSSDIAEVQLALDKAIPWWSNLSDVRQRVLADMAFNLGTAGLLQFKNMLNNVQAGNFRSAALDMLSSLWAQQVGKRASDLASMMASGKDSI